MASVELAIDGVAFVIHGLQVLALRHLASGEPATGIGLLCYRTAGGRWQQAFELLDELRAPIGHPVVTCCCELGSARQAVQLGDPCVARLTVVGRHSTGPGWPLIQSLRRTPTTLERSDTASPRC